MLCLILTEIQDEAHCIKTRTTMTAKATFALKVNYRWCLTGTPLQNRIGEFFSLIRFLNIRPFASYFCKHCPCESVEWNMDEDHKCTGCKHNAMQHVSVFNQVRNCEFLCESDQIADQSIMGYRRS